jgi:hemerythrin-like metal-binding protein
MKDLIWDNTLSIQVQEIDEDHHRLVELFNLLAHAVEEKASREYIQALLDELIACTVWHFKHEERLMLRYDYAGLDEHRQEHDELVESVKALQQERQQQGVDISSEDIVFLEHWLTGHILGADMDLGEFLTGVM